MSIFNDISRFLEERLDDFLKRHPHLELEAIKDQLQQQDKDTQKLILQLEIQEKTLQKKILSLGEEIKAWHTRIEKAKASGRLDLVKAAQEKQTSLFREGNQLWAQMESRKQRILKSKQLLYQIKTRQKEVAIEIARSKFKSQQPKNYSSNSWNQTTKKSFDVKANSIEQEFQNLETDEELKRMKRDLNL